MVVVIRCDRCGMELVIKADSIREFSVCQLADRIEYTIRIEMEEGETFERIEMLSGKFILCKKCMEDFRRETAEFEKKFMRSARQEFLSYDAVVRKDKYDEFKKLVEEQAN